MEEQLTPAKPVSTGLDIKELFFKYIRFLPLIIFSVALALFGAYLYLRYATPIYQSNSALLLKSSEQNGGNDGDRFAQLFVLDNSISTQNEIELLRSRQLMETVVENLGLHFQYFAKGNIREVHHYQDVPFLVQVLTLRDSSNSFDLAFEFKGNDQFKVNENEQFYVFGQPFTTPNGTFLLKRQPNYAIGEAYKVSWVPTRRMANEMLNNLVIGTKGATGILNLSLQATHPKLAADVLNALMKEYQVATIESKNETKRQTIAFVDDRLNVVSRELDSVTASLLAFQRANNMVNPSQSGDFFSKALDYEDQIRQQEVQIDIAKNIQEYLGDRNNLFDVVPSTLGLSDGTLNTLISAYNAVQLERKSLIDANVPSTNPRVVQLDDRLDRLRVNVQENLRNLIDAYRESILRLRRNTSEVDAAIRQLPEKDQQMLEIKKQQQMKQSVFNFLMEKREETAISLAATISNIKVMEEATVSNVPVAPNKTTTQLIAIVIGLLLPALFIVGKELLNDKVTSRSDIEKFTDVPILGEIGHSFSDETLVVKPNSRGMVAEQFRIIRSNLQYILGTMEKPVILVSSSFSGEGKSFISTNLGTVLSLANKKTIILEFDIRKPKILSGLNLPKKPGLTNWLLGKVKLEEIPIQVEGYSNLYVLPCGPVPPNPAELLLSPKMDELFVWLRANYDVVVMDTAPVGIVSDALTLSRFADATLYITRQGRTLKKQVGLIDELYQSGKLPHMSVVINDMKVQAGYGYYGYGKYGYTYGYGENSGYFDDEADGHSNGSLFSWLKGKKKSKRNKKHTA